MALFFTVALVFRTEKNRHTQPPAKLSQNATKLRVATANVAADEIVAELLRRQKQLDRWVGRSSLAFEPRYSHLKVTDFKKATPHVVTDNPEALLANKADVVILSEFNRPLLISQIKSLGIQVVTSKSYRSIDDIIDNIRAIGKAIGAPQQADQVVKEMLERLQWFEANPLYLPNGGKPNLIKFARNGVVSGDGTIFNELVNHIGASNIAVQHGLKGWGKLNDEIIALMEPDFIISPDSHETPAALLRFIRLHAPWNLMKNLSEDKLITLPERDLNVGSHHVVGAIERLHKSIASRLNEGSLD